MRTQPALRRADAPENEFFSNTEQCGEDKNGERDRAKDQAKRGTANAEMMARFLGQGGRQSQYFRQILRSKIADIQPAGKEGGDKKENEPGQVRAINNAHRFSECGASRSAPASVPSSPRSIRSAP